MKGQVGDRRSGKKETIMQLGKITRTIFAGAALGLSLAGCSKDPQTLSELIDHGKTASRDIPHPPIDYHPKKDAHWYGRNDFVVVGDIGFDFYKSDDPKKVQEISFTRVFKNEAKLTDVVNILKANNIEVKSIEDFGGDYQNSWTFTVVTSLKKLRPLLGENKNGGK